jgi:hypothetical protein
METYSMEYKDSNGRTGYAVILNNNKFYDQRTDKKMFRTGSEIDVENIAATLERLNFEVREPLVDLTARKMIVRLDEVAETVDFSNYSCFACFIMSHGDSHGAVYGIDWNTVDLERDIVSIFRECKQLEGKPKLFFVQACRGAFYTSVIEMDHEPENHSIAWPAIRGAEGGRDKDRSRRGDRDEEEADARRSVVKQLGDIIVHFATIEQYVAIRSKNKGSAFIRSLCEVLEENARAPIDKQLEVEKLLKTVNNRVGDVYKSQQPEYTSSLKKELFFSGGDNEQLSSTCLIKKDVRSTEAMESSDGLTR